MIRCSPTAAEIAVAGARADGRNRRKSSIDLVKRELKQLCDQLGSNERAKLDLHVQSIQAVEDRLTGGGGGACTIPAHPAGVTEDLLASSQHLDLAITAFGCDLTRVASVQFGHHQNTQISLSEIR